MECAKCCKPVVGQSVSCGECSRRFHPGCFKAYIVTKSAGACCKSQLTMPITPGSGQTTQSSASASSVDDNASLPGAQSCAQANTNELLLAVMEQLKQSESKLSSFIECQLKTNNEITSKLDLLNKLSETVISNTQRISSLEHENTSLKSELQNLKTAISTQQTLSTQRTQRTSDANELIVSGLPAALSIAPSAVARNLLAALGASDIMPHILNVRAVRKPLLESARDRPKAVAASNSFIITVTSSAVRDLIISRKRAKGVLRQGEICGGDSKGIIYVNKLLSKDCYELLQQTKRVAKERSCKYVWVRDGRICVRHSDGKPVIYINSGADLAGLDNHA